MQWNKHTIHLYTHIHTIICAPPVNTSNISCTISVMFFHDALPSKPVQHISWKIFSEQICLQSRFEWRHGFFVANVKRQGIPHFRCTKRERAFPKCHIVYILFNGCQNSVIIVWSVTFSSYWIFGKELREIRRTCARKEIETKRTQFVFYSCLNRQSV